MTTIRARCAGADLELDALLSEELLEMVTGGLLPPGFFQPVALINPDSGGYVISGKVQGTGTTASGTVNAAS